MHGSTMSPAQQYQSPSSGFFINSPTTGPLSLPNTVQSSPSAPSFNPHYSHSKGFQPHFSGELSPHHPVAIPRRPEPIPAANQRIPSWPNVSLHYPENQISSPTSSDSTDHSSPTSPDSPAHMHNRFSRDPWQNGYQGPPMFPNSSFPPPNTVAPPIDLVKSAHHLRDINSQGHRPDAVFGGGNHRYPLNPRGCPETTTSGSGGELVESRDTYSNRLYAGSTNTIAPNPHPHGFPDSFPSQNGIMGGFSHAGSHYDGLGSVRPGRQGGQEEGFTYPVCVASLGISDEDLILMSTRDLNKFLKSKGLSRDMIKVIKQQRRTMKNRGYAASCRVKREDQCRELKAELAKLG
eukprot:GFUD01082425.1.p1 GENE.GFUD01082425.1~~GFUD01082425.1.p1  ORF type:complete len:349 (-),score=51.97 GFUD01082425.1:294-1340(-)